LVGLQPDIILTSGTPATAAVQREARTIQIGSYLLTGRKGALSPSSKQTCVPRPKIE
jgi:hypothetical protein